MTREKLGKPPSVRAVVVVFAALLAVFAGASWLASAAQGDFGAVDVSEFEINDPLGRRLVGKLFRPNGATADDRRPGVLYVHGYQSNRETGAPTALELARRGFVAMTVDTLGRGDSDDPWMDPKRPGFDTAFGARSAFDHLASLPFVDPGALALVGHSLGSGISYEMALTDERVRAVALTGFGFDTRATASKPRNMLMAIGQYDEFRARMTGTTDIAAQWMGTAAARAAFGRSDARLGTTYGAFEDGTARRVIVPKVIHVGEPVSAEIIGEVAAWMESALSRESGMSPDDQIWPIVEWAALVSMIACFLSLLPLAYLLSRLPVFAPRPGAPFATAPSRGELWRSGLVNAGFAWLYLPCALIVFAIHKYVVRVDGPFPMMVVNVIVFWFFVTNGLGLALFARSKKRRGEPSGLGVPAAEWGRALGLAALLFAFAYGAQGAMEAAFQVDFRFVFAFANDLTPHRALLSLRYLPFLAVGFLGLGAFLHLRLGAPRRATLVGTFAATAGRNLLMAVLPIAAMLAVQYVPLLLCGAIPLVGPGGMFVLFVFDLFHVAGVLLLLVPLSTWLYLVTGRPHAGALASALIAAWMFASTQVIAPVPID